MRTLNLKESIQCEYLRWIQRWHPAATSSNPGSRVDVRSRGYIEKADWWYSCRRYGVLLLSFDHLPVLISVLGWERQSKLSHEFSTGVLQKMIKQTVGVRLPCRSIFFLYSFHLLTYFEGLSVPSHLSVNGQMKLLR